MGGVNSGPKPNLDRWRRMAELRRQGLTLSEIGRRFGVSKQAVHYALTVLRRPRPGG
jgi:lambda repressor-like predicted transcriptional regulator